MEEVNIVGAGAIGSFLGSEISKNYKVRIFEEHEKIGYPVHCSGLVSSATYSIIGLPEIKVRSIRTAYLHSPKSTLKIFSKRGMVLIDRAKMEKKLVENAEKNGAEVLKGTRLGSKEIKKLGGVVVGCDGVNSEVAKSFGMPPISNVLVTFKKFYKLRKRCDGVHLFFGVSPDFFGWCIPNGSIAEIGIGSRKNVDFYFKKLMSLESVNSIVKKEVEVKGHISSYVIPMEIRKKTYSKNAFLVGDAAGHTKFATGGGLAYGIRIARLISGSMSKEGLKSAGYYDALWRRKYNAAFKMQKILRIVLNSDLREFAFLLGKIGKKWLEHANPDAPWSTSKF